jgi:phage shock protein A
MEHEEQARGLEREVDRLEEHSEEVRERVDEARRDWEAKKSDQGVPGAQPDPAEEDATEPEAE